MWLNFYFQNRIWVDDDNKFAIENCSRLTFAVINRNYRRASEAQDFTIRAYNEGLFDITSIWSYFVWPLFIAYLYIKFGDVFKRRRNNALTP